MIISKALGTYNMKDATIYLTPAALVVENTTAAPAYQFCIITPLKDIEKTIKKNGTLLITKTNGETLKLRFYKISKIEFFYDYLSNNADEPRDDTKCLFCDATLQGEYCTVCGHKRVEVSQEPQFVAPVNICWNCGAESETKVDFCAECGANQNANKHLVRIGANLVKKNLLNICPRCGSRNIKHYRKGYNYKVGFWGAIFGVRGAGYAGGFDANKTCCRCMNCGKDWETDNDYRLIDK